MSQGSLNMSEKGAGIESSRSGAGPKPAGNELQDVGPVARSSSSGGVEDLSTWLKYESSKKYEESLSKLALDNSKIQGKHLVSYSLDDLNNEKKRVKNELKVYDQDFINKFKRAPSRSEKEPMRNLYMYYKRLKQYIEKREKIESQQ
jgi:hypothetical protein